MFCHCCKELSFCCELLKVMISYKKCHQLLPMTRVTCAKGSNFLSTKTKNTHTIPITLLSHNYLTTLVTMPVVHSYWSAKLFHCAMLNGLPLMCWPLTLMCSWCLPRWWAVTLSSFPLYRSVYSCLSVCLSDFQ